MSVIFINYSILLDFISMFSIFENNSLILLFLKRVNVRRNKNWQTINKLAGVIKCLLREK